MGFESEIRPMDDPSDVEITLQQVRRVDPTCTIEAVARYVLEIADATRVLESVSLEVNSDLKPFSAAWTVEEAG